MPGLSINAFPEVDLRAPDYSKPREMWIVEVDTEPYVVVLVGWGGVGRAGRFLHSAPRSPCASSLHPWKKPRLPFFVSLYSLIHSAHSMSHRNISSTHPPPAIFHLYYSRCQMIIRSALLQFLKFSLFLLFVTTYPWFLPHCCLHAQLCTLCCEKKNAVGRIAVSISFQAPDVLLILLCIFWATSVCQGCARY